MDPSPWNSEGFDSKLDAEMKAMTERIGRTVMCLREWDALNKLGLLDLGIPDELKPAVDNVIKQTRQVLKSWSHP